SPLFSVITPHHPGPPLFSYTTLFRSRTASCPPPPSPPASCRRRLDSLGGKERVAVVRHPLAHGDTAEHQLPTVAVRKGVPDYGRSEEHTSELQSRGHLVCRLLLEKKK